MVKIRHFRRLSDIVQMALIVQAIEDNDLQLYFRYIMWTRIPLEVIPKATFEGVNGTITVL